MAQTSASGENFSFSVPPTEQGERVQSALSQLFERGWAGTPVESMFSRMDDNQRLRDRHVEQLSGALIAASTGELTAENLAWLAKRHQDVGINSEQFNYVVGTVAGALTEGGEARTLEAILPLVPDLHDLFVRQPE